ncbi:MAG: N-acetyl-gamma-glutamyl-phosphate reductase [Polyangiaceae bacterium]|nr:N-acetyl-gamma-glutamyl-phosphate reductase [Polyangiaceae bacterium]
MTKVFIDGQEGTTGLQIRDRLVERTDLELLEIDPKERKAEDARRSLIQQADILITCLPDDAARASVGMIKGDRTRVIDPSTAHRTLPGWTYGLPELHKGQRTEVQNSQRVAVPGCHATGFVLACYPLIQARLLPTDYPLVVHSLTGYSGAGRKGIELYQSPTEGMAARPYALELSHKHLPEMQVICGLTRPPIFEPVIVNLYKGMLVSVPLYRHMLAPGATLESVHKTLSEHYAGECFVRVMPLGYAPEGGALDPTGCNDTNRLDLFVFGNAERILLVARLDNLGKGASGAAVQCLNLMLGVDERTGLRVD